MTLDSSYRLCREVARREAKNFYYAFRVLPKAKSDGMCAVYAFMRHADDIADDESRSRSDRQIMMDEWLDRWRSTRSHPSGMPTVGDEGAVFYALGDTQRRFGIPDSLLEDLVRGTYMDLEQDGGEFGSSIDIGDGLRGYATFQDLYQYCYLVASVVGLVCIRIFGYRDPAAETLAEKTGIAFQLTNILRDVKEDAERGRIYLPQELLACHGLQNGDVLALAAGEPLRDQDRAMIGALSTKAWEYYGAADELLPLINADSRAALRVLVEIYSGLLARIDRREGDVFSSRVGVPATQKIFAVVRGMIMSRGVQGS